MARAPNGRVGIVAEHRLRRREGLHCLRASTGVPGVDTEIDDARPRVGSESAQASVASSTARSGWPLNHAMRAASRRPSARPGSPAGHTVSARSRCSCWPRQTRTRPPPPGPASRAVCHARSGIARLPPVVRDLRDVRSGVRSAARAAAACSVRRSVPARPNSMTSANSGCRKPNPPSSATVIPAAVVGASTRRRARPASDSPAMAATDAASALRARPPPAPPRPGGPRPTTRRPVA